MTEIFYQVYLLTPANCALSERATLPGIIRATSTVARHPLPYDHFYNPFQLRTFDMRLAALVPKSCRLWLLRRVRIALRVCLECLRLKMRQNATHEPPPRRCARNTHAPMRDVHDGTRPQIEYETVSEASMHETTPNQQRWIVGMAPSSTPQPFSPLHHPTRVERVHVFVNECVMDRYATEATPIHS